METLLTVWIALLGVIFGSFANVLIYRIPRGLSIVRPPSHCPSCDHELTWYENVPLVSYVIQRGRCANCRVPISPRYFLVEALTGLLFVAASYRLGFTWALVPMLVFIVLLVPLIFIDAEHWLLPWELTLPGIALGILLQIPLGLSHVVSAALGAVLGFVVFRGVEFLGFYASGQASLGGGDKYLLAMCGAVLGPRALLGVIFLSSVQGAIFGLIHLKIRGRAGPTPVSEQTGSEPEATFTPAFRDTTRSFWGRLAAVPYAIFLQDVPDPSPENPDDFRPTATSLPYGPWIALAALEVVFIGHQLSKLMTDLVRQPVGEMLFGPWG